MISFEEKFPNLKEEHRNCPAPSWITCPDCGHDMNCMVEVSAVEKYCLDKQRVKEALNKVLPKGFQYSDGYREELLKELSLDEESERR